ncbi:MAG: ribonuclease R [Candidatus Nitronauta litoralis]|uniref:Ribonuclease R n=1 Tax=Candidatus Nitronauta litoralis TaxID=2705533 RepID=A0A7T0BZ79_9BACT|nr:MAG: ribonuclease R [Candidatus Nitronauta litoralis]
MDLSSENLIRLIQKKTNRPLKFSELMRTLNVPEPQRREFRGQIKEMVEEGALVKLKGGRYGLPDEMSLVSGMLKGHPDGYGFLLTDAREADLYVGRKQMNGAMHQDKVLVRVESGKSNWGKPEGRVIRILQRAHTTLVGVFEPLGRDGWVIPSDENVFHDIFIPGKLKNGAKPGQIVVVEITDYPTRHQPPAGKVLEVLGKADDPRVELRSIFHKFGVHQDFPPQALEEARRFSPEPVGDEGDSRRDLTSWLTFTIDGERAKDFDDAVSLEVEGPVWRLGVHIADVSNYVTEDSALDKEAFDRGTSIYYPDGVIPMLPVELSNEVCSLKPLEKRLTITALMEFTKGGELTHFEIFPSVIKSRYRFTYTKVWDLLQNGDPEKEYTEAMPVLTAMHRLSRSLRKRRFEQGSVEFEIPEPEVRMNPDHSVEAIVIADRNPAHQLIEEFMLAANRVVASYLTGRKIPAVHRIHETPDPDKLITFQEFLESLGYRLPSIKKLSSKHLHNLLQNVSEKPEARAINTLMLRAMKKAIYSEEPVGHFALGFEHYTHFTSPIRRYPDLAIHRLLKYVLKKKKLTRKECSRLRQIAAEVGAQSTDRELKAQGIEREVNDLRRAQFMLDKVGHIYDGIISGVQAFGFFVELKGIFVEGLVRVSNLQDDYYLFYEHEYKLKGQHRGRIFRIGDEVRVRVAEVDLPRRRIDLMLALN